MASTGFTGGAATQCSGDGAMPGNTRVLAEASHVGYSYGIVAYSQTDLDVMIDLVRGIGADVDWVEPDELRMLVALCLAAFARAFLDARRQARFERALLAAARHRRRPSPRR